MSDQTLAALTAATPATGGLFYGTQSGADRKFTLTAAGAALCEAASTSAQRLLLLESPIALSFASTLSPDVNDGWYRKVTLTGAATLNPPANGVDGIKWKARFTASGADRTLTLNSAIKVPSLSSFAGSQVIASGKTWILQLEYNGSAWILETLIGGY
jgi:hypothetical protein